MQEGTLPRHFIGMEEDIVLVCRKSKISMQEGREVEGKSVIRSKMTLYNYYYKRTNYGKFSLKNRRAQIWNNLPIEWKSLQSYNSFKRSTKI